MAVFGGLLALLSGAEWEGGMLRGRAAALMCGVYALEQAEADAWLDLMLDRPASVRRFIRR